METGPYNITPDEARVSIHFGVDRVEDSLIVRLKNPESNNIKSTYSRSPCPWR